MAELGYIQLTRKCNQKCLFCSNPENENTISFSEVRSKLNSLSQAGYTGVIFTGGEPTLSPILMDSIGEARKENLEPRIISNGQTLWEDGFVAKLIAAGLSHVHLSLHSVRDGLQTILTGNPDSLSNLYRSLELLLGRGVHCDINTVICSQNADHLDENVIRLTERFPKLAHFVWNNLDPSMNRVCENPHTVAKLYEFELSLFRAMNFLERSGRTFRVERVPLCYMADFAFASTETRKIVLNEARIVHFLDDKGVVEQKDFRHGKAEVCEKCRFDSICAGLDDLDGAYSSKELNAIFLDPNPVVDRILNEK